MLIDFPEETMAMVLDWLLDPRQGLVIMGEPGRGKTHLAAAICRAATLLGARTLLRRAFQFFSETRHALTASIEHAVLETTFRRTTYCSTISMQVVLNLRGAFCWS
jgi:DNA replication protein DnaC